MFVKQNDLTSLKAYFSEKLAHLFSGSELKQSVKWIVTNHLNISDVEFMLGDVRFSESDLLYFQSVVKRLEKNEPLQHILGTTFFCDIELKTDYRALIPRPETEELVFWIKETYFDQTPLKIADVCAGSGCISFALKALFPTVHVIAIELFPEAIELMTENKTFTQLPIDILPMDVLKPWGSLTDSLDVIVSNPPYIPRKDQLEMHANVLQFEPHSALFVEEDDPLSFYREIGKNALPKLREDGWIFFEIHEALGKEVIALLEILGFVNIELRKDLQGKDRMVRGQKVLS